MCEGLGCLVAARAGVVGELTPPGGVGGEVAFACSHLVYSSGDEPIQSHEGVGGEPRRIRVVFRGGVKGFPVFQESVPGSPFEGAVCL